MTATAQEPSARRSIVRAGAIAGILAAVATTVVAAIARAADVSLGDVRQHPRESAIQRQDH